MCQDFEDMVPTCFKCLDYEDDLGLERRILVRDSYKCYMRDQAQTHTSTCKSFSTQKQGNKECPSQIVNYNSVDCGSSGCRTEPRFKDTEMLKLQSQADRTCFLPVTQHGAVMTKKSKQLPHVPLPNCYRKSTPAAIL